MGAASCRDFDFQFVDTGLPCCRRYHTIVGFGGKMQFDDMEMGRQVEELRKSGVAKEVAWAHNLQFEECLGDERRTEFENFFSNYTINPTLGPVNPLQATQAGFEKSFIRASTPDDHPVFSARNAEASLDAIDDDCVILRLEDINDVLTHKDFSKGFDDLKNAVNKKSPNLTQLAVRRDFAKSLNAIRQDMRPAFVAREDEIQAELSEPDWPDRLRIRLGLGHYMSKAGPFHVAAMRYTVREVREYCRSLGYPGPIFTKPTALDQGPWEYFFPAPKGMFGGRCMPLRPFPDAGSSLFCELQHPRFEYNDVHLMQVGTLAPQSEVSLKCLRNAHLSEIRRESGSASFGEVMGADVND
jgi:hypothetical protein